MTTVYPGSIDTFTSKTDGVDYNLARHINDLQDSAVAVENELGANPKGSYADVAAAIAAMEAHLALPRWTTVLKSANQTKNSDTTIANDNTLTVLMPASKLMAIRGQIFFSTVAAADYKYRLNLGGTPLLYVARIFDAGGVPSTDYTQGSPTINSVVSTLDFTGVVQFNGVFQNAADATRYWGYQWAQNASNAGNTITLAGSYVEYLAFN